MLRYGTCLSYLHLIFPLSGATLIKGNQSARHSFCLQQKCLFSEQVGLEGLFCGSCRHNPTEVADFTSLKRPHLIKSFGIKAFNVKDGIVTLSVNSTGEVRQEMSDLCRWDSNTDVETTYQSPVSRTKIEHVVMIPLNSGFKLRQVQVAVGSAFQHLNTLNGADTHVAWEPNQIAKDKSKFTDIFNFNKKNFLLLRVSHYQYAKYLFGDYPLLPQPKKDDSTLMTYTMDAFGWSGKQIFQNMKWSIFCEGKIGLSKETSKQLVFDYLSFKEASDFVQKSIANWMTTSRDRSDVVKKRNSLVQEATALTNSRLARLPEKPDGFNRWVSQDCAQSAIEYFNDLAETVLEDV